MFERHSVPEAASRRFHIAQSWSLTIVFKSPHVLTFWETDPSRSKGAETEFHSLHPGDMQGVHRSHLNWPLFMNLLICKATQDRMSHGCQVWGYISMVLETLPKGRIFKSKSELLVDRWWGPWWYSALKAVQILCGRGDLLGCKHHRCSMSKRKWNRINGHQNQFLSLLK